MKGNVINSDTSTKTIILFSFIVLKFLIQYSLILPEYDLQRDEYLHLDQANHLAWGYLSVPPVTSCISYIIKLLGNSVFWIKFFPALFGALTTVVVWKTIEELGGKLFALILGASCVTFSVLFRLNTLYQPNSLDVLCWTLLYFFIIKYTHQQKLKWLYYAAITFAVGFLNKYNILFAVIGLLPAFIISPERKIFLNKKLYFIIALAFVIILPNLLWQYQNNFPVIHHMKELADTQLVNVNRLDFVRSQFLFFPGTNIIILIGLYSLIRYEPFKKYRLLLWSFFITLGVFIFLKAKDYYAIGIYPIYFAFGSVYIAHLLEKKSLKILKPICVILAIASFIPMYLVAFPNRSPEYYITHKETFHKLGMLRWEDGKEYPLPQDFADMLGWKELATKVDKAYLQLNDPEHTLVLCDNYGQAGAINFYSKAAIHAVSFNADYINWFDLHKKYNHLIRVKNHSERNAELKTTSPFFKHSVITDSVTNKYAREFGTTIFSFSNAKIDINPRLQEEINKVKAR